MRVDEVMSEDPVWVDEQANLGEAARKMVEAGVHHLPVLRAGVLVGILSDRDVRGVPAGALDVGVVTPALSSADAPITDVMSREVASVTPDTRRSPFPFPAPTRCWHACGPCRSAGPMRT